MAAYQILSKSTDKFVRKGAPKFLLSHKNVTLNEHHGHSNRYQTIQFHNNKFEKNQSVNAECKPPL